MEKKKATRLNQLADQIGAASNVRKPAVMAVQAETFRQIRGALERGERVYIPEFGTFMVREAKGTSSGSIRFKPSWNPESSEAGTASEVSGPQE